MQEKKCSWFIVVPKQYSNADCGEVHTYDLSQHMHTHELSLINDWISLGNNGLP